MDGCLSPHTADFSERSRPFSSNASRPVLPSGVFLRRAESSCCPLRVREILLSRPVSPDRHTRKLVLRDAIRTSHLCVRHFTGYAPRRHLRNETSAKNAPGDSSSSVSAVGRFQSKPSCSLGTARLRLDAKMCDELRACLCRVSFRASCRTNLLSFRFLFTFTSRSAVDFEGGEQAGRCRGRNL